MFSRTALFGIDLYQNYVSPNKGYRCAYSVLHGGTGCSGYVKHAIHERGVFRAIPIIRARFSQCRVAYETIKEEDAEKKKQRKDNSSNGCSACDGCGAITGTVGGCGGLGAAGEAGPAAASGCASCDLAGGCTSCDIASGCASCG